MSRMLIIIIPLFVSAIATARSVFVPVDPHATRTWWQSLIFWLQLWMTAWAPEGMKGLGGGQVSVPFLHMPKKDDKMTQPPLSGAGTAALLAWITFFGFTACGITWGDAARLSLGSFEQGQSIIAKAATDYEHQRQENFRSKATKVQSLAELEKLEAAEADFFANFGKVVDSLNKLWTATTAIKITLPIAELAADKNERYKIDQWITTGLGELLSLRDLLSKFGVVIPSTVVAAAGSGK